MAAILPLYLSGLYLSRYGGHKDAPSLHDYFDSKEEAVRHYEYLKQIYQSISAKEIYSPYVFPWESTELTRSEIVLKMAYITWMTNNSALKDDLCSYLPSLDTYMRAGYIGVVLAPPTSPLQEEYVLQSLGDRSQDVREEAYKALSVGDELIARTKPESRRVTALQIQRNAYPCYQSADETAQRTASRQHPPLANRQGCRTPPGRIGHDEDHTQCRIPARYLSGIDPDS